MNRKRTLTSFVKEYLAHRRSVGFELADAGRQLLHFAQYADQRSSKRTLSSELAIRWAGLPKKASGTYRAHRLNIVRQFAKYVAIFDSDVEIPPENVFGPAYCRVTPHIFTKAEIASLLAATRELSPADGLRPHTYSTVFGLLICTGMRLSEVLHLTRTDVDLKKRLITIRATKFKKSRLVPMHCSTAKALLKYARMREHFLAVPPTDAFFVSQRGTALCVPTVETTFRNLQNQLSWTITGGRPAPRIHDMRHTFACERLTLWYEQGVEIEPRMLALSTYLGHACVKNTYWYLSAVPQLMQWAGTRFEQFAEARSGDDL